MKEKFIEKYIDSRSLIDKVAVELGINKNGSRDVVMARIKSKTYKEIVEATNKVYGKI